jgi:hypothetical protein
MWACLVNDHNKSNYTISDSFVFDDLKETYFIRYPNKSTISRLVLHTSEAPLSPAVL